MRHCPRLTVIGQEDLTRGASESSLRHEELQLVRGESVQTGDGIHCASAQKPAKRPLLLPTEKVNMLFSFVLSLADSSAFLFLCKHSLKCHKQTVCPTFPLTQNNTTGLFS